MASVPYLGQRMSFASAPCTVRYTGPIAGAKGTWLGVEWDDPTKGKHSGEHEDVNYFECLSKHPTAGSFIRPTRPADTPLSFLEALRKKYAIDHTDIHKKEVQFGSKVAEEVGFDKIRKQLAELQQLRIVLLDGLCLVGVLARPWDKEADGAVWTDELKEIGRTCPKLRQLDLSSCLLEHWVDVVGICKALPELQSIALSGNRFRDLSASGLDSEYVRDAFTGIAELSLDNTLLTWSQITDLASFFPSLTTLSLASNSISLVSNPLRNPGLSSLSLLDNAVADISAIRPLSALPQLNTLSLRSNPLVSLDLSSLSPFAFPVTTKLDISLTLLPAPALAYLPAYFPALLSLRITATSDTDSMLTVARIASITNLNFSNVTPAARTNAELYYLSKIAKELAAAPPSEELAILSQHPRWQELCNIHGAPTIIHPANGPIENPNTLGARLVTFRFRLEHSSPFTDLGQRASSKPNEKTLRIPGTISLYRVYALVGALFDLLPLHIRLVWETGEWDPVGRSVHRGRKRGSRDSDGTVKPGEGRQDVAQGTQGRGEEGTGGDDSESSFSCSSGDDDDHHHDGDKGKHDETGHPVADDDAIAAEDTFKGKWVRREVELVQSTREVGFYVEGKEASVRVEPR